VPLLIRPLEQVPRYEEPASATRPLLPRQNSHSKASLISPTPSDEADDEESSWGYSGSEMDDDYSDPIAETAYADEDTRPTSQKELWGWYSYGWAAEVFAICAMGKH